MLTEYKSRNNLFIGRRCDELKMNMFSKGNLIIKQGEKFPEKYKSIIINHPYLGRCNIHIIDITTPYWDGESNVVVPIDYYIKKIERMDSMDKKIKDPVELDKAFQKAKASAEIEGFKFTKEDEHQIKSVMSGQKSRQQLIKELKEGK